MRKIQGDFTTENQARQAADALKAAGIPDDHVRVWNIIPDGEPVRQESDGDGATAGATTGAIAGGFKGAVLGAVAGNALDGSVEEQHIPLPSGVRVVVDVLPSGPDAAGILLKHGAANVH